MKVLYITNGINGAGGLERVLSIKASYLADHYQYDVTILCLNNTDKDPFYAFSDKIKMVSITVGGTPIKYIGSYKRGIQKLVKTINPDVISVCDDGLKGFFIPKIIGSKIPIVYERHASIQLNTNPSIKGTLMKKVMQKLAADFSVFVVLTKSNLAEWTSSNIVTIANPLTFYPEKPSALDTKHVIVVGSQSHNKGADLVLKAWQMLQERFPDWKLSIYGKEHPERKYENLAKELNINNKVLFYSPVRNIEEKYLESSLMVLPSRSEGFGMVLIEAMACGVPCVSFDCPSGPRDIVKNAVDGYLVPAENIEVLALKMMDLMQDDQKRKAFGLNARENVKRFMPERIVKEWDVLFKSLVQ